MLPSLHARKTGGFQPWCAIIGGEKWKEALGKGKKGTGKKGKKTRLSGGASVAAGRRKTRAAADARDQRSSERERESGGR